jgi:hypothetical protein
MKAVRRAWTLMPEVAGADLSSWLLSCNAALVGRGYNAI